MGVIGRADAYQREHRWAGLAPFTDNTDLTVGDQRAYISYAKTELHKSFETIDVSFSAPPPGPPEPEP